MKLTNETLEIKEAYENLVDKTIEAIEAYKQDGDINAFKATLCTIIEATPNVCYLDPDILSCYGIEVEDSCWCECSTEEQEECVRNLKELVNETEEFESYQLSEFSSGSILYTIFGDTYDQVR